MGLFEIHPTRDTHFCLLLSSHALFLLYASSTRQTQPFELYISMISSTSRAVRSRFLYAASQRSSGIFQAMMSSSAMPWATIDPTALGSSSEPYNVPNIVDGKYTTARTTMEIPHPLNKDSHPIFTIPDTQSDEIQPFLESLRKVPKSGMHNPLKNPERYLHYGEISRKVSRDQCVCREVVVCRSLVANKTCTRRRML